MAAKIAYFSIINDRNNEKTCFLRGIGSNSIRVRLVFMKKAVRVSILLFLVFYD